MPISRRSLLTRLRHKFLLSPRGYGHPISGQAADQEYTSGSWSHFESMRELSRYLVLAGTIAEMHPECAVLDVGCGSGQLERMLQPYHPRQCLGMDFSAEAVARARALELPRCEFVEGNFETWRPTERFDAIVFNEVLGYARDPAVLVADFSRFLTPDGHFFVSYFRFGHWAAIWHRVEKQAEPVNSTTVTNAYGQTWDIKVLRPRKS